MNSHLHIPVFVMPFMSMDMHWLKTGVYCSAGITKLQLD